MTVRCSLCGEQYETFYVCECRFCDQEHCTECTLKVHYGLAYCSPTWPFAQEDDPYMDSVFTEYAEWLMSGKPLPNPLWVARTEGGVRRIRTIEELHACDRATLRRSLSVIRYDDDARTLVAAALAMKLKEAGLL